METPNGAIQSAAASAIQRKPVHAPPAAASPPIAGANTHLSSFEAAALSSAALPSTASPTAAAPPAPTHDLSSFEASALPVDTLERKDEKKDAESPSLESGSIAPYAATRAKPTLRQRFDTLLPPHRKYLKGHLTRRAFLLLLLALLLLAILAIGLGAGLGAKKSSLTAQNLPLPPGSTQTGQLTFYDPGGPGYGSCGEVHYAADAICAVSHLIYDAVAVSQNPNENPLCGRRIRVSRVDERDGERKSVDCRVVDRCTGCVEGDVDLSLSLFEVLAAEGLGRVEGEWAWLD